MTRLSKTRADSQPCSTPVYWLGLHACSSSNARLASSSTGQSDHGSCGSEDLAADGSKWAAGGPMTLGTLVNIDRTAGLVLRLHVAALAIS